MDRTELESRLDDFKQACIKAGYINEANKSALELEEVYPGAIPTSFIINVHVKKEWLATKYSVNGLKELITLLYEKADPEALENILTLRLCDENEAHFYDNLPPQKNVA